MTGGPRQLLSLLTVIAAVGVPLLIAGLEADDLRGRPKLSAEELAAKTPRIAAQVEKLRDLRFDRAPRTRIVAAAKVRRKYARLQRKYAEDLAASEAAYKTLGIVAPNESLADVGTGIAAQVDGYYDPKAKRLFIVRNSSSEDPAGAKITIAHELDHALEDQRFGIDEGSDDASDDRGLAESALIEGSATEVETAYALRYIDFNALLRVATEAEQALNATAGNLPKAFEAELSFPYTRGRGFIAALRKLGSGWNLVDIALRSRPPLSTEQVLHPLKYLSYERPLPVRLRQGDALPTAWNHLTGGVIGEFETYLMLRPAIGMAAARRVAAGWGGQRLQLWRRGTASCSAPCPRRDVLFGAWRWDSEADARQFDRALRAYLPARLGAERRGPGLWSLKEGWVGLDRRSRETRIAFAPTRVLARRLAATG
jgi:hypothetical protein